MDDLLYGDITPDRKKRFLKHLIYNVRKYQTRKGIIKRKKFQQQIAKLSSISLVSEIQKVNKIKPRERTPLDIIERKIDLVLRKQFDQEKERAFHSKMLSRISEMDDQELGDLKNLKNRASIGTIDVSTLKDRIKDLRSAIRSLARDDHIDHVKLKQLRSRLNDLEKKTGLKKPRKTTKKSPKKKKTVSKKKGKKK